MPYDQPVWLPGYFPTNNNEIPVPPAVTPIPTDLDQLTLLELAEMAFLLKLACGRNSSIFRTPKRYLLCLLATIIDYEIFDRKLKLRV